jgi:hypothetical protein
MRFTSDFLRSGQPDQTIGETGHEHAAKKTKQLLKREESK